jgi:hypothetical protein
MSRPRRRMLLDNGLCFDVNVMVRAGLKTGTCKLILSNTQEVAADLLVDDQNRWARLRLQHPNFDQTIGLTAVARNFGGRQWYWLCPMTDNRCSVLYRPHGCKVFASQKYWRQRRMAYRSQFLAPHNRAHLGIKRIEARLGGKDDDDMLYKPKWQRWGTFNRYCERLDVYDSVIEAHESVLDARLMRCLVRLKRRR